MKRVAILCQNAAYGRHALATLGAHWPDGYEPALVLEGPCNASQWRPPSSLALRLRHHLGGALNEEERQAPALWAQRFGARHHRVHAVRGSAAARLLRRQKIAALVCLGFPSLCDDAVLDAVPLALNAHPSLLPHLRGPSPIFWWLRSGAAESGVSVHRMIGAADRGAIVVQQTLTSSPTTTGMELAARFGQLAGLNMALALDQIHRGTARERAQPQGGTWAPRPRPEDAFVEPVRWQGRTLLRFVSGAPYWQTPRIIVGGTMFFARCGIEFRPHESLPGDFVQVASRLEVAAQDGVVALDVQSAA